MLYTRTLTISQKEASEAPKCALALASRQALWGLCSSPFGRSAQATRLSSTDRFHSQPVRVKALVQPSDARDIRAFSNIPADTFLRNSLKYALNAREVVAILMQRLVQVDKKVRTDSCYPAGFMDVISIEKTGEHFRLVYDTKGRFTVHRISSEESEYKLGKVKRVQLGKGGIPFLVTHDART